MRRVPALLCALILCAGCSEPPQKEMSEARGAIDAARAVGAEQYASAEFQAATTALKESEEAVQQRDYRLALSRAIDASQRAQEAARLAAEGMARTRSEAEAALTAAESSLQQLQTRLEAAETARVPARELAPINKTASDVEAVLQKARASLDTGDYLTARTTVKDTVAAISEQIKKVDEAITSRGVRPVRRRR